VKVDRRQERVENQARDRKLQVLDTGRIQELPNIKGQEFQDTQA
jgi:hypothetical protein